MSEPSFTPHRISRGLIRAVPLAPRLGLGRQEEARKRMGRSHDIAAGICSWTRAAESGGSFVRSCMELQKKRPQEAWSAPERSPANLPANRASALWEALARDQNRADAFNAVLLSVFQNVAAQLYYLVSDTHWPVVLSYW
jgi:hypothetical protein